MKIIIPNFESSQTEILVVGDVMLDRYWKGSTERISPEAPVPIVKIDKIENRPGGAANVAMNINALGAKSHLISFVGIDEEANILKNILNYFNIKYNFVELYSHPTITKLRIVSRYQQLLRIDFEKKFSNKNIKKIFHFITHSLPKSNIIVLSDYSKGVLVNIEKIIKKAKLAKIPILIDPKGNDFSRYKGATLLTPNINEFEAVIGKKCQTEKKIIQYGMKTIYDYDLSALVITRSENGITLIQPNKNPLHFPTQAKKVFDVTGAGDTVISVLAASLSVGESLEKSCLIANLAAGIAVGKFGNATVNKKELLESIKKYNNMKK